MNLKKKKIKTDKRYEYFQSRLDEIMKNDDNPKYKFMKNLAILQKNITEIGFSLKDINTEEYEEFSEIFEYCNKLINNSLKKNNIEIEGFEK